MPAPRISVRFVLIARIEKSGITEGPAFRAITPHGGKGAAALEFGCGRHRGQTGGK
jgi:hypothetical protein